MLEDIGQNKKISKINMDKNFRKYIKPASVFGNINVIAYR